MEEYPLTLTFARLMQYCDDGHRNLPGGGCGGCRTSAAGAWPALAKLVE